MDYTFDDLVDLIARHDEHEDYYRGKMTEWLDRRETDIGKSSAVNALRVFASRANDAGVLGDPMYWFPIRDAAKVEADRLARKEEYNVE